MRRAVLIVVLGGLAASRVRADPAFDAHLLAGAQYFQAGRYSEALVEFRVAERMAGDGGPGWYVAATLVKLKRPEDALLSFARAEAEAPGERDGLFDYYHALACYDAKLFLCADRLLAAIGDEPGPRIAAQARKIRGDLAPVLAAPAPTSSIDWYHAQGQAALNANRGPLAAAYFEEAAGLAGTRRDAYRRAEAMSAGSRARAVPVHPESKR
jgi:hypothetical protein